MSSARQGARGPRATVHQNSRGRLVESHRATSRSLIGETRAAALQAPVQQLAGNRRQANFAGPWRCYQMLACRNEYEWRGVRVAHGNRVWRVDAQSAVLLLRSEERRAAK